MKYLTRQEEQILLAVHQLGEKAYLVTIRKHLNKVTGRPWSVGAVYVPLNRLHKLGYLDTRIGEPNAKRGRNAIRYYSLTKISVKALSEVKQVQDALWTGFNPEEKMA